MNKHTTFRATTADFEFQSQEHIISISPQTNVGPEQLVAIKGYPSHLCATEKIIIQGSEVKSKVILQIHHDYQNIIFCGHHTGNVQGGSSYVFNKVRVEAKIRST